MQTFEEWLEELENSVWVHLHSSIDDVINDEFDVGELFDLGMSVDDALEFLYETYEEE